MTTAINKTQLNHEQEEAANHINGPCIVLACPGSGKTTTIVERTCRLVESGISPRNILSITFTNKAAKEMKERTIKRIGPSAQQIYISTFHSLCANLIRKYGASIGYGNNMTICDSDDQEAFMSQVARQLGHEIPKGTITYICSVVNRIREELIPESKWKEEFEKRDKPQYSNIATEYVSRLRANNSIDFSGLLSEAIRLLDSDKEVLNKLQSRFTHIQVDESQDTNYAQFQFVLRIGNHNNIFAVGDSDQSIYSWRGARYKNIEDFINERKAKLLVLPTNYRSTPEIVEVADRLIKHNKSRQHAFDFKTVNKSGCPVECYSLPIPDMEGKWIASRIKDFLKKGYKPEDIAVLYRLNSMSRPIEQGLIAEGISYEVIGGMNFFDRMEVKDALSMLKFYANPHDGAALSRFINSPSRGIGEVNLGKIENFAKENSIDLVEALNRANEIFSSHAKISMVNECKKIANVFLSKLPDTADIGEVLHYLVNNLDYYEYLESDKFEDSRDDRKNNLQDIINSSSEYSKKYGNDIVGYVNQLLLTTSSDKNSEVGSVSLMTMHASKGLEFKIVFLPSLLSELMPHKRAITENAEGLEEERRLFYVALTRAKEILITSFSAKSFMKKFSKFSYGKSAGSYMANKPSMFLSESNLLPSCKKIYE